jgi:amidase
MDLKEYSSLDAHDISKLIDDGEVTPGEAMECAIELASETGAQLNAICFPEYERGLSVARRWKRRGPFAGVPFLLKDSGLGSARLQSGIGSRLFQGISHATNSTLAERFESAGLLAFARSTVPELCMAPTTEAVANGGPTRNPYDLGRSPGGSSGGAAAAVASGIVSIAHGSDGGGSIRTPASCCGVFGLKPSRGAVPFGPARGEGWGGLATDGVISRSVRDTAVALDAIVGLEPGAPYASPEKQGTFASFLDKPFARPLRIAVWDGPLGEVTLDPICAEALRRSAAICESLGHQVEPARPPSQINHEQFVMAHSRVLATNIAAAVDARLATLARQLEQGDLEPALLDGYHIGKSISGTQYAADIALFHSIGRFMDRCFENFDIVLTSTLARPPAKLGELSTKIGFLDFRRSMAAYLMFLPLVNASGQPAASVPLNWTNASLPIGTQMIGRFGREDLLIQLASQLERSGNWQPSLEPPR